MSANTLGEAVEKEVKLIMSLAMVHKALIEVDLDRLREKVAFSDSPIMKEMLENIERGSSSKITQIGEKGFVIALANPSSLEVRQSIEDAKFFLFVVEEYRKHIERQKAELEKAKGSTV